MPDAVKLALSSAVRQIGQADIRGVRTVRPDGIHLTLKFLGDIEAGRVAEVSEAIDRATAGLDPFDLGLGKAGVFPNWRSPRVLWIGLDGDLEALGRLHEAVEREIVALGLEADNRAYQPHLTLGRVRDNATSEGKRRASEVLSGLKIPAGLRIHGNHASLMRPTFTQRGAVHDALFSASLRGN